MADEQGCSVDETLVFLGDHRSGQGHAQQRKGLMKLKTVLTIGLLAFVCVSVVVALRGEDPLTDSGPSDVNGVRIDQTVQIDSGVVVYYFHRQVRCTTCNTFETYTRQVLDGSFSEAQAAGSMQLVSVNYETSEDEHFVEDFQLTSNSVVLVRLEAGKAIEWKNLDQIWDLVKDAPAFSSYIQKEIQAFVAGAT